MTSDRGKRRFGARSEAKSSEPSGDRTVASGLAAPERHGDAHPERDGKRRFGARSEAKVQTERAARRSRAESVRQEPSGDRTVASGLAAPECHGNAHPERDGTEAHRAGVVALLGAPNAGKSTLLNALLGQKLAIVTAKPQTTRSRILGILSLPHVQLAWMDTPGLHAGGRTLNRALNAIAEEVAADCDAALILVDPRSGWDAQHAALQASLAARGAPALVVGTKADLGLPPLAPVDLTVSARDRAALDALIARVVPLLPASPPLWDAEQVTDRTLRFLAAEEIREALFEELDEELPYATAVEIDSYDESKPDGVRIRATLWVERDSQKGIVLGHGGRRIKRIGQRARAGIAELAQQPAHLSLWVKVDPRWSKKPKRLQALGYY